MGNKSEIAKIRRLLSNELNKTFPDSSSHSILQKLLSGKYDDKLVYCKDISNKNNYISSTLLSNGLHNISVIVDTDKYKKAPSDHIKRIDWIYENMDKIYISLEDN